MYFIVESTNDDVDRDALDIDGILNIVKRDKIQNPFVLLEDVLATNCNRVKLKQVHDAVETIPYNRKRRQHNFDHENKNFTKSQIGKGAVSTKIPDKWLQCEKRNSKFENYSQEPINRQSYPRFECDKCHSKFNYKNNLKRHIAFQHNLHEKVFKCKYCTYKSDYQSNLQRHIKTQHKKLVKNLKCVKNKDEFRSHTKNSLKVKQTRQREFKTENTSHLKSHKMYKRTVDESIKRFKCKQCNFESKYNCSLTCHVAIQHATEKETRWFHCEFCSFKTKYKTYVRTHHFKKHPDKSSRIQCA